MNNKKYNGWANYATWRVMLEVFDGEAQYRLENEEEYQDVDELAVELEASVQEMIESDCSNALIAGWANAFIEHVDWYEIAEHVAEEAPELIKETK